MSLSTHVLDAGLGRPAEGVPVRLTRGTGPAATGEAEQSSANGDGSGAASPSPASPSSSAAEHPKPEGTELQELRERVERLEREVAELRVAMRHPSPSPLPGPAHDPPRFDPRL